MYLRPFRSGIIIFTLRGVLAAHHDAINYLLLGTGVNDDRMRDEMRR